MLADLDELVLRVRNPESRRNVEEAVRVLRAGSPRAAILLTWLAVVFDVIGKLRELEESGDAHAKRQRAEFEDIRAKADIRRAQEFESRIPTMALDLELISQVEKEDLERLQQDRHRCAHPSQTDEETPYTPSDELGRAHIRTAVEYLLQHPAAQGKAALERVQAEIDSPYFPDDDNGAFERLRTSPLGRARRSLVRSLAITLVKAVLENPLGDLSVRRRRGLGVVWLLYPELLDQIARDKLAGLVAGAGDARLLQCLFLIRTLPNLWGALPKETKDRIKRFVDNPPEPDARHVTMLALGFDQLRASAMTRLHSYGIVDYNWVLSTMGKQIPTDFARALISALLGHAEDGDEVDASVLDRLQAVASLMDAAEIRRFFEVVSRDGQPRVSHSSDLQPIVSRMNSALAEREFRASGAASMFPWEDLELAF